RALSTGAKHVPNTSRGDNWYPLPSRTTPFRRRFEGGSDGDRTELSLRSILIGISMKGAASLVHATRHQPGHRSRIHEEELPGRRVEMRGGASACVDGARLVRVQ